MAVIQPTLCSALSLSARSVVLEVREATFKSRRPQDEKPSCSDDGPRGVPARVIGPDDGRKASVHRCSRQNKEDRVHGTCPKYPGVIDRK